MPANQAMDAAPHILDIPLPTDRRSHLHLLSSLRSVVFHTSFPSEATIRSAIHALSLHLNRCDEHDPIHLHQTLNLLTHISLLHPNLSPLVIDTVHSYLRHRWPTGRSDRLMLDALAAIITVSGHGRSRSSLSTMEGSVIISLLSSPIAAVRLRVLNLMAQILNVDSDTNYARAFLGFLKDPYPLVRRAALDGLVGFAKLNGAGMCSLMTEGMYDRTVKLLLDLDEIVRLGAIRLVSEWGQILADANCEVDNKEQLDEIFLQLCSMVRDMSMKVRVEAFLALGKTRLVSEDVLLQSLSKKILGNQKERKSAGKPIGKESALSTSSAAGAFVHGLEDEFHEVRRAASASLGSLVIFSIQFADDALNLLMDILNDDTSVVRLQTLKTMFHMASYDHLKVQEKHMHMFLNVLVDSDSPIRHAARELLRVMKLPNLEMFRSSINGLLTNLETYPEDEAGIFFVLFCIGKSHWDFVVNFVKEFSPEMIEPSSKGELGLDRPRVAALLVLIIAAPFSNEQLVYGIPTRLFSYAVPFLGRISSSLEDVINRDSLLAYLFSCSKSNAAPNSEEGENFLHGVERCYLNHNSKKKTSQIDGSLQQVSDGASEVHFQDSLSDLRQVSGPPEAFQQKAAILYEATHVVKLILKTVADAWPLIKLGFTEEVLRILRGCKEELSMITVHSHRSVGVLAFASQYVKAIKFLTKAWEHLQPRKCWVMGKGVLDLLLDKLDTSLTSMRSSKVGICCGLTLKRLQAMVSRIQVLCEPWPTELPDFVKELIKCCEVKINDVSYPLPVHKLVEIFSLEQIVFSGRFKHIKAELHVPGNDSENPIPYISGLPVGITFQITLYNISSKDRLWLRMALGNSVQYIFLDFCQFEGGEEVRKCTVEVPFYKTPKAASFTLRACCGMECPFEDVIPLMKGQGGPKCRLTFLSKEKDIYLVIIDKNS
ncbi:protein SIEL isoform X2 [Magnolia sinica]|uniref:protein SIEL isoform X2 n=1 Tax=Magnolia sinica TaxID=86752 RepID=UPI00265B16CA|nr:protein SIEL isoform X2 [Magnolia sinica]